MGILAADPCGDPANEIIIETNQFKQREHHIVTVFARFDEATVFEKNERAEVGLVQLRVQAHNVQK